MLKMKAEFVVVGSGAGGATLAKELTSLGRKVVMIEKGKRPKKLGNTRNALKIYDKLGLLKSKEGVVIYRGICAGGTTVVSAGNMVRCLQEEFLELGIDLEEAFVEAEQELQINPVPNGRIIRGSRVIKGTAQDLNLQMDPMPKCINFEKCISCGDCVLGCQHSAKWTAINYLDQAIANGAVLIENTTATKVLFSNGKAVGIKTRRKKIMADVVILATGGLASPVILQKSGITAGNGLFCDLFNVTYGTIVHTNQIQGVTMAAVNHEFHKDQGFILSPYIDPWLALFFSTKGHKISRKRRLGIMTKIADERTGRVFADGIISKKPTARDTERLQAGHELAKKILIEAGVKPDSIFVTSPRGAHPGGTAAVDEIVDKNMETEVKNLFVCDASVLPIAPGLPPMLTIIALAKWLARSL